MNNSGTLKNDQSMLDLHEDIDLLLTRDQSEDCCSLCGKRRSEVDILVSGQHSGFICDQCVARAIEEISAQQHP